MTTESCTGTLNLVDLAGSERIKVAITFTRGETAADPEPANAWDKDPEAAIRCGPGIGKNYSDPEPVKRCGSVTSKIKRTWSSQIKVALEKLCKSASAILKSMYSRYRYLPVPTYMLQ